MSYFQRNIMILIISRNSYLTQSIFGALLAIIDKYGVQISQWAWLCQALFEVSMNKIALWINVSVDDWSAERAMIGSNVLFSRQISDTVRLFSKIGSNKSYHFPLVACQIVPITSTHTGFVLGSWIDFNVRLSPIGWEKIRWIGKLFISAIFDISLPIVSGL